MRSQGRPCPKCGGLPTRTIEVQHRETFTYRRHRCLHLACGYVWPSKQFDYTPDPKFHPKTRKSYTMP